MTFEAVGDLLQPYGHRRTIVEQNACILFHPPAVQHGYSQPRSWIVVAQSEPGRVAVEHYYQFCY